MVQVPVVVPCCVCERGACLGPMWTRGAVLGMEATDVCSYTSFLCCDAQRPLCLRAVFPTGLGHARCPDLRNPAPHPVQLAKLVSESRSAKRISRNLKSAQINLVWRPRLIWRLIWFGGPDESGPPAEPHSPGPGRHNEESALARITLSQEVRRPRFKHDIFHHRMLQPFHICVNVRNVNLLLKMAPPELLDARWLKKCAS